MIVIIIAGGSGTRLWPLSTPTYPKHLLRLTDENSLLQNTYQRAKMLTDDIYVISEASHSHHVAEQLPDLTAESIIVEPGRRGTASCLLAALAIIKKHKHDPNEPIVFMHADHHIRDSAGFSQSLLLAVEDAQKYKHIVLLGLVPTYAATCYGYIEYGDNIDDVLYKVKHFKEKPTQDMAEAYLKQGSYFWNMGFFIASLEVFEQNIRTYAPKLWQNYTNLLAAKTPAEHDQQYLSFDNEAVDMALIERVDGLLVRQGAFDWMDVGSYPEIHVINEHDGVGNTLQGKVNVESVTNSLVRNDTDIPLAVIGLDSVVVISTEDGILVAHKDHAQKVGDVSKRF